MPGCRRMRKWASSCPVRSVYCSAPALSRSRMSRSYSSSAFVGAEGREGRGMVAADTAGAAFTAALRTATQHSMEGEQQQRTAAVQAIPRPRCVARTSQASTR